MQSCNIDFIWACSIFKTTMVIATPQYVIKLFQFNICNICHTGKALHKYLESYYLQTTKMLANNGFHLSWSRHGFSRIILSNVPTLGNFSKSFRLNFKNSSSTRLQQMPGLGLPILYRSIWAWSTTSFFCYDRYSSHKLTGLNHLHLYGLSDPPTEACWAGFHP